MKRKIMRKGPINRSRKNELKYIHYRKSLQPASCQFCEFHGDEDQVVENDREFWVVKNIFPYDIWDGCQVKDHLMITPKRHVVGISELLPSESKAYLELIGKYEKKGYSSYTRSPGNKTKSVAHLHTHLIKLNESVVRSLVYFRNPHFLLYK